MDVTAVTVRRISDVEFLFVKIVMSSCDIIIIFFCGLVVTSLPFLNSQFLIDVSSVLLDEILFEISLDCIFWVVFIIPVVQFESIFLIDLQLLLDLVEIILLDLCLHVLDQVVDAAEYGVVGHYV
jgi:hypothetical protein